MPGFLLPGDYQLDEKTAWLEHSKEWIVLTPGVVSGFHWAVKAYTHPGDNVIVQTPVYYPFFKAVKFNGCHIVENQLQCTNGRYEIDFDDLNAN